MSFIGMLLLSAATAALFCSGFVYVQGRSTRKALQISKQKETELAQTLAELVDGDGNIRGQLMLPGKMPTDEAVIELKKATVALEKMTARADDLQEKLEKAQQNNEHIEAIVELFNQNQTVQIRLPGKTVFPNKTPCGKLCKHSMFVSSGNKVGASENTFHGMWACLADQGIDCDQARKKFLDASNQCVMFERQ